MRTTVRRLCGQHPGGPNGVADQLCARMSAPISPPSRRNSGARPPPPLPHMRFTRSASIEKQYQCDRNNPPAGRQEMSPKPDTPIPAINWLVRLGVHAPRRLRRLCRNRTFSGFRTWPKPCPAWTVATWPKQTLFVVVLFVRLFVVVVLSLFSSVPLLRDLARYEFGKIVE